MPMPGTVVEYGAVVRNQSRQGQASPIPRLPLVDVTGAGVVSFLPERQYVFSQGQGAVSRKRLLLFADWNDELQAQIVAAGDGVSPLVPIQPNDVIKIGSVAPYEFGVDDADCYPMKYILIYTWTYPINAAATS